MEVKGGFVFVVKDVLFLGSFLILGKVVVSLGASDAGWCFHSVTF